MQIAFAMNTVLSSASFRVRLRQILLYRIHFSSLITSQSKNNFLFNRV